MQNAASKVLMPSKISGFTSCILIKNWLNMQRLFFLFISPLTDLVIFFNHHNPNTDIQTDRKNFWTQEWKHALGKNKKIKREKKLHRQHSVNSGSTQVVKRWQAACFHSWIWCYDPFYLRQGGGYISLSQPVIRKLGMYCSSIHIIVKKGESSFGSLCVSQLSVCHL